MRKKLCYTGLIRFCALLYTTAQSQDLSGEWTGNYGFTLLMKQPEKVTAELFFYNDSMVTGLTHAFYKRDQYEHHKISGKFRKADSTIVFTEDSIISYHFNFGEDICPGRYTMKLVKTASKWIFTGRWKDRDGGLFACPSTSVYLEKPIPDSLRSKIIVDTSTVVTNSIPTGPPVSKQLSRIADVQKVLDIVPAETDSIAIELYDNGEIDGDSVTVYLNDSLCIARLRLSDVPRRFYISLNADVHIQKLTLAAENLGSIPPNTALMIVTTRKKKRYEIYLSSSLDKNAVVEFFLTQ